MTITTRTLAFAFKDAAGNNADGTVAFCPTTPFTNSGSNLTVARETQTVTLAAGAGSVTLYATDDADTSPTGATYTVTETITGADPRSYRIQVPAGSGTLQLADIAPAVSQPMYSYATTAALSALELDDLADVDAAAPTDGYFLKWVAADSEWQAAAGSGGGTVDVVSNVAADRILGRITSGSGDSEELTAAQVITLLNLAATYQPLDADLTAIAALTTTATGRALLEIANAAAGRTALDVPSNGEAILDSLIDAAGDLVYGTANDTPARLARGTEGQVLRATASTLAWADSLALGVAGAGGKASTYYEPPFANFTTNALTTGVLSYMPLIVAKTGTIDRIAIWHTTNGSAGAVTRLGVYADSGNGQPGALLVDGGTVATDAGASAAKTVTVSLAVTPGIYWLAAVGQVATSGVHRQASVLSWFPMGTTGAIANTSQDNVYYEAGVTGALPATATPISLVSSTPRVAVRFT